MSPTVRLPEATPTRREQAISEAVGYGASSQRAILLLQGPVGPFFSHLAAAFLRLGRPVDHVRFNAGDAFFGLWAPRIETAPRYRALRFHQGRDALAPWLRGLCWRNHYGAIVLFGGERPAHRVAREIAGEFGIPVICLEEGYVRGGFVTVELGGNNARSPLAGRLPPEDFGSNSLEPPRVHSFSWLIAWGFLAFSVRNAFSSRAQRELDHKRRHSAPEAFYWLRNFARWVTGYGDAEAKIMELPTFDVVPLQVSDDAQLTDAAAGWSNQTLIAAAIESLARCAPADRHLVFKVHPMERGHTKDPKLIRSLAQRWGVADRVHCTAKGSLGTVMKRARGMITINSTSGFSALHAGRPLLVLGRAIYRHPELLQCGGDRESIDQFWTNDFAAPVQRAEQFIDWLKARALIAGDFYAPSIARETADAVASRAVRLSSIKPVPIDTPAALTEERRARA